MSDWVLNTSLNSVVRSFSFQTISYFPISAVKMKYEELCKEKKLKYDFFTADAHQKPGYVICKLAEDLKAEFIVLGQRGLGTLSRTLYGSTSDYVLHHAQVPVMIVPMPGKKVNNASFKSVGCI